MPRIRLAHRSARFVKKGLWTFSGNWEVLGFGQGGRIPARRASTREFYSMASRRIAAKSSAEMSDAGTNL